MARKQIQRKKVAEDLDLQIVDSARACFRKFGVKRTRMEDVAEEAGISRQVLYSYFDGRQSLIDSAIYREIELIIEEFTKEMPEKPSLQEAIIKGSITGMKLVRSNPVLADLFENSTTSHLPAVLLDPERPTIHAVLKWWKPVFQEARKTGELAADIDDKDLMEWLGSIHYMFMMRTELPTERQEQFLKRFFLPALRPDLD